ncbi:MAG: hypothetical protein ACKPKO_23920, partial [Candidatus Fonsibacter sp.]
MSIDFDESCVGEVKELLQTALLPPHAQVNPLHRRSYGNCGDGRLQAWDITVQVGSAQKATKLAWDLWRIFAPLHPVIGFSNMINWDKGHQFM